MKEQGRKHWTSGGLILLACLTSNAIGQSEAELADRMLARSVTALEQALASDATPEQLEVARRATGDYLDALGRSRFRDSIRVVLAELKQHEGGALIASKETASALLEDFERHRKLGHPERMLPALLLLRTKYPEDVRVLYSIGEAYGVASPAFHASKAEDSFRKLRDALRADADTDKPVLNEALARFLPEVGLAGRVLDESQEDRIAWLRRHLLTCCDALQRGEAIDGRHLAGPRLDRLYELLVHSRRKFAQTTCRRVLDTMIEIEPANPVFLYAQAEVCCSSGTEFNPERATAYLKEFLVLTDPSRLDGPGSHHASMNSGDVVRDLARFQLVQPRSGLEDQRLAARELLEEIQGQKFSGLMLVPDAKDLKSLTRKLTTKRNVTKRQLASKKRSLTTNRRRMASIPNTARGRQKRREFEVTISRQEYAIRALEARLKKVDGQLKEIADARREAGGN